MCVWVRVPGDVFVPVRAGLVGIGDGVRPAQAEPEMTMRSRVRVGVDVTPVAVWGALEPGGGSRRVCMRAHARGF